MIRAVFFFTLGMSNGLSPWSMPHKFRHLGSTSLFRYKFKEIMNFCNSSKYPGRNGPWPRRYGQVSCFILWNMTHIFIILHRSHIFLELSKNPRTAQVVNSPLHGVTWPPICSWIISTTFLEISQIIFFFYSNAKLWLIIRPRATNKVFISLQSSLMTTVPWKRHTRPRPDSGGDLRDLESTNDVVQLHNEDIVRLLFEAGPRRIQSSVPVESDPI